MTEDDPPRSMPLSEALTFARDRRLFLHYDTRPREVDVWSCGRTLPIAFRRAIYQHRGQLAAMMRAGDIRVCPAPHLHRPYWTYNRHNQRYVCEMCLQLGGECEEVTQAS